VSALDPVCLRLRKAYTQPTGAKGELSSAMSTLVTYPDFVNHAILRSKGRSRGYGSAMRRILARRGLRILSAFRVPGEQKEEARSLPGKMEVDDQVGLMIVRLEEVEGYLRRRRQRILDELEREKLARRERRRRADCSMVWWRKLAALAPMCYGTFCVCKRRPQFLEKRPRWEDFLQRKLDYGWPPEHPLIARDWEDTINEYSRRRARSTATYERELASMRKSEWGRDSEYTLATVNTRYVQSYFTTSLGLCPYQYGAVVRWPGSTIRAKVGWKIGQRKYEELDNLRKDLDAGRFPEGEEDAEYISRRSKAAGGRV